MKLSKKHIRMLNKMYQDIEENTILDDKLLKEIEKEESMIGKELLLGEQISLLSTKLPNKEARNQLILYLIRLFKYNNQVYEALSMELKDDRKLLKSRVNKGFKEKNIHDELYKQVLKIADRHFQIGKKHLKQFKEKKEDYHGQLAFHHKVKAEELYDILLGKDVRKVIKHLALTKLTHTYEKLIRNSEESSTLVNQVIKKAEKKSNILKQIKEINNNIQEQNLALRHFATNYSKSLIHTAEYVDKLSNKIIIYRHKK